MAFPHRAILTSWTTAIILAQPLSGVAWQQASSPGTPNAQHDVTPAEMRDLAWAAYTAGVHHETSAVPILRHILEVPPVFPEPERTALIDAALDALIQMDAAVPARTLRRYFDVRPVQTLLLLANTSDRDPVLLALLPKARRTRWYAIANLLLRDGDPGLPIHLLSTLTLHLTITVRDGDLNFGYGSGACSYCGDEVDTNPRGYPPRAVYGLQSCPGPEKFVLADGPHPVYYSRRVVADAQFGRGECGMSEPDDADRVTYLNAIRGFPDRPRPSAETSAVVQWSTAEALIAKVEELRGSIERDYEFLIADLISRGAMTVENSSKLPARINIHLRDEREDKSIPLPSVSAIH